MTVSPYTLQHNEAYFPDPYAFRPSRWLDVSGNREVCRTAYEALRTFSTGSRSCAGKAMAYLESRLVLAETIFYFDFEPMAGALGKIEEGTPGAKNGRDKIGKFQICDIFQYYGAARWALLDYQPAGGPVQGGFRGVQEVMKQGSVDEFPFRRNPFLVLVPLYLRHLVNHDIWSPLT